MELFKSALFFHDTAMDFIVVLSQVAKDIRNFLLFFVTSLPRGNEIVGFKERALLNVCSAHIEAILVEHDGLALHFGLDPSL